LECEHLAIVASAKITKQLNNYPFSLVAFAMDWRRHPLPHRELIYAREIGKMGHGLGVSGSSL